MPWASRPRGRRCGQFETAPRIPARAARQRFEREHDQRIAREHRERRAEFDVNGRLAAPQIGVVETGQIVMDERGAMQQFDRGRGGVGRVRVAVAAGHRHRHAQLRADAVAAGEYRIAQGRGEQRGRARSLRMSDGLIQGSFDSRRDAHSPSCVCKLTLSSRVSKEIDTSFCRDQWSSSAGLGRGNAASTRSGADTARTGHRRRHRRPGQRRPARRRADSR